MSNQSKLAELASTGVTKAELGTLDGVAATLVAAELNILDGVTATAAEINILDTVTTTAGELNLIDGGTARGTTAVADGDGVLVNDAGTMRMTNVTTLATYMGTKIGGGLEFIATADASDTAALAFTGFDSSKYDSYLFTHLNILPATDNQYLRIRLSIDSGSNYLAASDSYTCGASGNGQGAGDGTYLQVGELGIGNSASDAGFSGDTRINGPHLNVPTYVFNHGALTRASGTISFPTTYGAGKTKVATVVNAVQFSFTSGNITSGSITMYGMVNA